MAEPFLSGVIFSPLSVFIRLFQQEIRASAGQPKVIERAAPNCINHPGLWDEAVNGHLIAISKKEMREKYGDENFIPYIPAIPKTEKH